MRDERGSGGILPWEFKLIHSAALRPNEDTRAMIEPETGTVLVQHW